MKYFLLLICCLGSTYFATAQATVTGKITDDEGMPAIGASVFVPGTDIGILTDTAGQYTITIPSDKKTYIKVTYVLSEPGGFSVKPSKGETIVRNLIMARLSNVLQDVTIKDTRNREEAGSVLINRDAADINPSPIGGYEGIIKTLVGSKNELTSQYTVRGGNYDENLVYVNDFEIYRPFLVRSGQQEGLSFVNPDLTQSVSFSVGGFQSKYGDKMSSVLDVTYKRPDKFGGSVLLSFLGANVSLEGASKNKKLTYLIGARQKSNQYLLKSQPTKGQYNPSFTDLQGLLTYKFSDKWDMEVIANYARNRFNFTPEESESAFGYVNQALKLTTIFNGNEMDQFDSRFAGWSLSFRPSKKTKIKIAGIRFSNQ